MKRPLVAVTVHLVLGLLAASVAADYNDLKTAMALGLTISPSGLARADEAIE